MSGKPISRWPAWYFGPGGQKAIFERIEDVPVGWFSAREKDKIVEPGAEPLPDGDDAWGGHSKPFLIQALRAKGAKISGNTSARKLFERAVELNAIPGYGPADTKTDGDSTEKQETIAP